MSTPVAPAPTPSGGGRWTSKRSVILLAVVGAALAAVAASQPWGTGTATEQVVGMRSVTGTGGQLAPLVPALALVGGAASVAAATTGRVARAVAAACVLLAGLATVGLAASTLAHLATALGERAASLAQSRQTIAMTAAPTAWPWAAIAGGAVLTAAGALALLGIRTWPAPSRRYERPGAAAPARELSLWEQVGRESDADQPQRRDTPAPGDGMPRT